MLGCQRFLDRPVITLFEPPGGFCHEAPLVSFDKILWNSAAISIEEDKAYRAADEPPLGGLVKQSRRRLLVFGRAAASFDIGAEIPSR